MKTAVTTGMKIARKLNSNQANKILGWWDSSTIRRRGGSRRTEGGADLTEEIQQPQHQRVGEKKINLHIPPAIQYAASHHETKKS